MASPFLLSRTSAAVGLGLGLSLSFSPLSPFRSAPIQCQYAAPSPQPAEPSWAINPNDPILPKQGGTTGLKRKSGFLTPSMMRQVSLGSVLGLVAGVGLRAFSRALAVLLGMGIVFVEWAASKGYNLLPINRMQKYVKGVDLQKAMTENMPFKMTFGTTMALGAFAQL
ncbi:hypothetical protein ASPWEDRAFT_23644 [Aspergillus wentii DTO 134E9]|uniref:FUN14 domain-containing protein n=1 Tax=Aspergillus wentii DTO 134E9 TaxID=1073089 RepID=A0A1L9S333_ASPWE|nr:uncharacterized protein ASPWEDRAFT_23644 [Aspergillus wentii DTO 134E9]KAI9929915.1 hypothetical protein MW887_011725 [Aspergillus wentii]OJJ41566.1 hypothetical protein ASPWEDRAFT_23644 [Aspergillus wentii DTO 134E9]